MNFYAQTMPGAEKIAWLEIKEKLPGAKFKEFLFAESQNGIVCFDYDGAAADLFHCRSLEDIFVTALPSQKLTRDWIDLRKIADEVADTAVFTQALKVHKSLQTRQRGTVSYRVISRKYGKHQYRRKDVADAVMKGMARRAPKWRPVADHAQIEIWVNVLGSQLLGGIRLSDRTMRHRFGKKQELPAALRPSLAAAMVYLSQPQSADRFLDPLCGSGTILMERRLAGPFQQMLAGDVGQEQVLTTRHNLWGQSKTPPAATAVFQADAQKMPVAAGTVDKIVTNLPFGKQISSADQLTRLYPQLFREMERVLAPNGRAIVLSSEFELVKTAVRHCPGLNILTGYSVAALGQWGRIYIIQRD